MYGSDYRTVDNFQDRLLSLAMLMMNAIGGLQMDVRGWWDVEFRLDEPLMLYCSKLDSHGLAKCPPILWRLRGSHSDEFCSEHMKINQSAKQSAGFSLLCSTIHCL